jgi:hypothetical protein
MNEVCWIKKMCKEDKNVHKGRCRGTKINTKSINLIDG